MIKRELSPKLECGFVIELLMMYDSPMFEAWKVPKRPVNVLCDVT